MRAAVDVEAAHPANAFAAIVVEGNRFFTLVNEIMVQHIEHFQKRHVGGNVVKLVCFEGPLRVLVLLAPDLERYLHSY